MTGPGSRKQQPKREWVEAIVKKAREAGTAVFMKDSLKPIWGDDILREHPPRSEYVNRHPYCLHLWKKIGEEYETPPKEYVG